MNFLRGWIGEKKTSFYLWLFLRKKSYYKVHNIILPSENGTTQIDHLIISIYGIFIVETKNKRGWIFGSKEQSSWTQSIYGRNYSFQNPLRQTFRQKKILSAFLSVPESKIHTVVNFSGNCSFKTPMPDNVMNSGLGRYIKRFRNQIFPLDEVNQIISAVRKHLQESSLSSKDHLRSLRKRHSSNTICPKCGSNLLERTAKQGPYAGRKLLGCEKFPKCRFTKNG
ncbi:nuclease-related domain-containing protein [Lunatibacter salilacus]|uniref:nuclease-related domain-containing protein n=1 Tax=Lunatibacter salilacus TaxID=2483804 RepID=UPI00131B9995